MPGSAEGLATATLRGAAWAGAARFGGKALFFASTLLLARLLDRQDFGVAAYAITLIALFGSLPTLGLGPALIHHRDDPEILDTGFWLGVLTGCAAFALVWLLAPASAWIFDDGRAVDVTRALALVFPLESLRNVHATLLRKRLAFDRRFVPEISQSGTKGLLAIALAFAGFGYWSLIWGSIGAAAVGVPVYWWASGWRPGLRFDAGAARTLLPFGGHVMALDLLSALVRNVDYVFVGRLLGAATLGVYTLAFRIPDLLIRNLCTTLGQVLLPVYARLRAELAALRAAFLATLGYVTALTAPLATGLALVAEPLVITAFSEKWREVATVIPPICAYALLISLSFNLGDLYKALGRPDVLSRLALLRAGLAVPALWVAAALLGSRGAVGWAQASVASLIVALNLWLAGQLFGLPVGLALWRLLPVLGACAVMAGVVVSLRPALASQPAWLQLVASSAIGAASYALALRLLARDLWEEGFQKLQEALARPRAPSGVTP